MHSQDITGGANYGVRSINKEEKRVKKKKENEKTAKPRTSAHGSQHKIG